MPRCRFSTTRSLELVDVSDRGWEAIAFGVLDSENDCLSFFCRAIEVTGSGLF